MPELRIIQRFPRYSVSDDGRVFNNITGRELSKRKASNGYLRVNLRNGNSQYEKPTVMSVHRLVAEAFVENPEGLKTVNHIDGNKENNHASNLEWMSNTDNLKHAWKTGLMHVNGRPYKNRRKHRVGKEVARIHNIESHNTQDYKAKARQRNAEKGITRRVAQMDRNTNEIINIFDNCNDAAKAMFVDYDTKDRLISRCARGKCRTAYGFRWMYV